MKESTLKRFLRMQSLRSIGAASAGRDVQQQRLENYELAKRNWRSTARSNLKPEPLITGRI